jgi:cell division protease FtsH
MGGGHDEREQTLNQLLVEMDGVESKANIILIAATNRPDILDPALLRPGRFDRQIPVGNPDLRGREAILAVHSKGKPFAADVDFHSLAKRTVGMSGADLANVINEAALLTARENGTLITGKALEESVDRVVGGPARKGRLISEQEKKITAYHEAGHTLAAWAMPGLEPVYKVTIQPRGRTGGHALVVPEDDKSIMTRSEMIARLVMAMGGRAAEELVFAEPTTGASSDIAMATKIARSMVTEYGMSAKLGAVKYGTGDDEPFLGRTYGHQAEYSIEAAREIDEAIRALIEAAHNEAWAVLSSNRFVLDRLAGELLEKETVERRELEVIFAEVEKRPRITDFDDFGSRIPSDQPPIKTPGELAIERGEPWPPPVPPRPKRGADAGAQPGVPAHAADTGVPVPAGVVTGSYTAQPAGVPPNWSGGVLPGPLGPLPGWGSPTPGGHVGGTNGFGPTNGQQNGYGYGAPQGGPGAPIPGAPVPGAPASGARPSQGGQAPQPGQPPHGDPAGLGASGVSPWGPAPQPGQHAVPQPAPQVGQHAGEQGGQHASPEAGQSNDTPQPPVPPAGPDTDPWAPPEGR